MFEQNAKYELARKTGYAPREIRNSYEPPASGTMFGYSMPPIGRGYGRYHTC